MKKRICGLLTVLSLLFPTIPMGYAWESANSAIPTLKLEDEFGMIEAEDCFVGSGYRAKIDEGASNGIVMNEVARVEDGTAAAERYAQYGTDDLAFYIDVETEGYYTIWIRARFQEGTAHGNFISHVNGAFTRVQFSASEQFSWGAAETVKLKKGKNLYGVMPRYNVAVDKFLITSSEYYAPMGMGEKPGEFKLGKEGESMKGLYYPLPPYTLPEGHPRLYIRPENVGTIRNNLTTEQNLPAWTYVKNLSDSNVNCTMDSSKASSYSVEVHRYLEACAFIYVLDKKNNAAYGKKAVDGLVEYLSTVSYSASGSLELARSGIVQYIAKVYDWCYDLLDDELKTFFIKKSLSLASKLECGWPSIQENAFTSGHGHEAAIQVDMMSLAVAMYEDYPDIWNVVAGRYFSEYVPINNFWHAKGPFQGDGDGYGISRFGYETKGNLILYCLGLSHLVSSDVHYMAYNQIYRRRPDGAFMRDGDIYSTTFAPGANYLGEPGPLFMSSVMYNDPYLKYELYKMKRNGLENAGESEGNTAIEFLIFNDPNLEPQAYDSLPLTNYGGEGHNMMTARTGWDDGLDSNTMIVSMKGGGRYRGDHQHYDAGNFTIYYKGMLAPDTGTYQGLPFYDEEGNYVTNTHFGSDHQIDYQQRTIAHNCMLVYDPNEKMKGSRPGGTNDGGQTAGRYNDNGSHNWEEATGDERILAYRLGVDYGPDMNKPAYSYIKTDITDAYSEKMKDYDRTMLFFNFFDDTYPGTLIVLDKVESSDAEFKKTWLLHAQEEPEMEGNTQTIRRTEYGYNGRLTNQTLLPKAEDAHIEKIGGPGMEYWVDGKNATAVPKEKGDESGNWRIEISPKTAKTKDYFLNVLQVADNDDTIPVLDSKYYESGSYYGVQIKDRVAYLSSEQERTYENVKIFAEDTGEETYKWVVDGLRQGRWKMVDETGKTIWESDVTEEGGVAYFEAPAGSYTISKMRGFQNIASKDFVSLNAMGPAVQKEVKLCYNTLYQYLDEENKIIEQGGKLYLPFEKMLSIMDDESTMEVVGDEIKLDFEDQESTLYLNQNKITKKIRFSEMTTETELSSRPVYLNGKLYIDLGTLGEVFEKTAYYDTVSKIIWLTNPFVRAEDYLSEVTDKDRINVKDATGTDYYFAYKPYMAHDSDLSTMAGTEVIGGTLIYEFKDEEYLDHVSIFWNSGSSRDYNYEFYVSTDGENYELASAGNTGFTPSAYVDYPIGKRARFFKIVAKGNSVNNWFVMKEMQFYKE